MGWNALLFDVACRLAGVAGGSSFVEARGSADAGSVALEGSCAGASRGKQLQLANAAAAAVGDDQLWIVDMVPSLRLQARRSMVESLELSRVLMPASRFDRRSTGDKFEVAIANGVTAPALAAPALHKNATPHITVTAQQANFAVALWL